MPAEDSESEPQRRARSLRWIGSVVVGAVTLVLVGLLVAFVVRAMQRPLPADEIDPPVPAATTP